MADILKPLPLDYSESHSGLHINRSADHGRPESCDLRIVLLPPAVSINHVEAWEDGPYSRSRTETIYCQIEDSRGALEEMLWRLKVKN